MNGYFKRVLILKTLGVNSEKCVVKLEFNNPILSVSTEVYCGNKSYILALYVNGDFHTVEIGKNARITENFKCNCNACNASALLVDIAELTPVAFGFIGDDFLDFNDLLSRLKARKIEQEKCYDDEIIADKNYYDGELNEANPIYSNAACKDDENQGKKEEKSYGAQHLFYEKSNFGEQNKRYYDTVREKIEEILHSHDEDADLKRAVGGGKFCKIKYDDERYYTVGIIEENDMVKYIIYAVPGSYSYVPNELKAFTRFIPLSPFQPLGSGYYVIFQHAATGEIISV